MGVWYHGIFVSRQNVKERYTHISQKSCKILPIPRLCRISWSVSNFVWHMHQTFSQQSLGMTSEAESTNPITTPKPNINPCTVLTLSLHILDYLRLLILGNCTVSALTVKQCATSVSKQSINRLQQTGSSFCLGAGITARAGNNCLHSVLHCWSRVHTNVLKLLARNCPHRSIANGCVSVVQSYWSARQDKCFKRAWPHGLYQEGFGYTPTFRTICNLF